MNEDQKRFLMYVLKSSWIFSRKYAKTFPHEYAVRRHNPKEFDFAVEFIRSNGNPGSFYGREYIYLEFEGYKYWTMGDAVEATEIINRERIKGGEDNANSK